MDGLQYQALKRLPDVRSPLLGLALLAITAPAIALEPAPSGSKFQPLLEKKEGLAATSGSPILENPPHPNPASFPPALPASKGWVTLTEPIPFPSALKQAVSDEPTDAKPWGTVFSEAIAPTVEPATPPPVAAALAETAPAVAPEAETRRQLLIEGDRLWLAGRYTEAERLYRKAKEPGTPIRPVEERQPFSDPAQLSPEGRIYWREAQEGQAQGQTIRMMVGLELLVETQPEFVPGQIRYVEALIEQEQPEEALAAMERAAGQFSNDPDLARAQVVTLARVGHLLEASIAARQFALLYPDQPQATEFGTLAEAYLDEFKDNLREDLTLNAIVNTLTSALSFVVTGNLYAPLTTLQTNLILLEGEDGMGEAFSNQAADQLELVQDEMVQHYVNNVGQRLARMTGRDEFEYEFFVVNNEELNAFALPGGKIFIFAGAILQSNSEAELAGLLAHELAHSVLSHGFELMMESTLAGNTLQLLPYGGIIADLALLRYSRDMERQADAFGTRLLATAGYAADGLHNLMQTLADENPDVIFEWLSTHPDTTERIRSMAEQIQQSRYNIFAFEGIERHEQVQQRLREMMNQPEEGKPEVGREGDRP